MRQEHILFSSDGPDRNVLKFKPPMVFTTENADELLDQLDAILTEIESGERDAVLVFCFDMK